MIEYIKLIISAFICGITMPLPVSSGAHYSILNHAMSLTGDEKELGFYFGVFGITFAVAILIMLRKIYLKSIKAMFVFDKEKLKEKKLTAYKPIMKNIIISIIPAIVLFIPTDEHTILLDYFDKFLTSNSLYLVGVACVINALVLLVAMWYTKQKTNELKRVSDTKSIIRMSVYQLVSYVVPGFSHIGSGSVNMLISDIEPRVVIREVYLYLAPQMLVVSIAKVVRAIVSDVIVDLLPLAIAVVVFAIVALICVHLVGKFGIRKLFPFFAVYSAVLGVMAVVVTFII